MFLKWHLVVILTILLSADALPGYYSHDYYERKNECFVPRNLYEIPLDRFTYNDARGFYQTIVSVPYFINTDLKCLTLHYGEGYRGKVHARQTAQTISTSYRLEDHLTITQLRPGVFETRSRNTPSLVIIEYVVEHNRHFSICSTCIYDNDRFVAQTAALVSGHRYVHPVTVEEALARAGIRVYSRFDISQTDCRYNGQPYSYDRY